jgi:hypothetical protein
MKLAFGSPTPSNSSNSSSGGGDGRATETASSAYSSSEYGTSASGSEAEASEEMESEASGVSEAASDEAASESEVSEIDVSPEPQDKKRKRGDQPASLVGQPKGDAAKAKSKGKAKPKKGAADTQNQRNHDAWNYKPGIETSLPPLHEIGDIFGDMTKKAMDVGFDKIVKHLGGRKLRVATMCSGTESPMLALGLIGKSMYRTPARLCVCTR